jgi:hypothetical protein
VATRETADLHLVLTRTQSEPQEDHAMRVRHRILVDAVCPVNGDRDRYVCDVYPLTLLCRPAREQGGRA